MRYAVVSGRSHGRTRFIRSINFVFACCELPVIIFRRRDRLYVPPEKQIYFRQEPRKPRPRRYQTHWHVATVVCRTGMMIPYVGLPVGPFNFLYHGMEIYRWLMSANNYTGTRHRLSPSTTPRHFSCLIIHFNNVRGGYKYYMELQLS